MNFLTQHPLLAPTLDFSSQTSCIAFTEAQKRFGLAPTDSADVYSCALGPSQGMVSIPATWPIEDRHPCLLSMTSEGGTVLTLDVLKVEKVGRLGLVALLEAAGAGTLSPTASTSN